MSVDTNPDDSRVSGQLYTCVTSVQSHALNHCVLESTVVSQSYGEMLTVCRLCT